MVLARRPRGWGTLDNGTTREELEDGIENGLTFLSSRTHETNGIQQTHLGPSRMELNRPNSLPPERFSSLLALLHLEGSVSEETSFKWHTCVGPLPTPTHPTTNYFSTNASYKLPDDIDATSLMYLVNERHITQAHKNSLARVLLSNTTEDGILQTYVPPRGTHVSTDICVNAMCQTLLYKLELDKGSMPTEKDLLHHLSAKEYLKGSRYYPSPDTFLFYLSRAVAQSRRALLRFKPQLYSNIVSRLGSTRFPMDSAQRLLALHNVGELQAVRVRHLVAKEVQNLMKQQRDDGGWELDALFTTGKSPLIFLGSREMPTILAVAALQNLAATE